MIHSIWDILYDKIINDKIEEFIEEILQTTKANRLTEKINKELTKYYKILASRSLKYCYKL